MLPRTDGKRLDVAHVHCAAIGFDQRGERLRLKPQVELMGEFLIAPDDESAASVVQLPKPKRNAENIGRLGKSRHAHEAGLLGALERVAGNAGREEVWSAPRPAE